MDILNADIAEIKSALENKSLSSKELVSFYLKRIREYDVKTDAFLAINNNALMEAETIDNKRARNEELPAFAGIPVAVKDNIATMGLPTTCASKILENYTSVYDATVVNLLKEAGFIIIGKLNMDEFAMGSSCENSAFKVTKNPWNLSKVTGGSSGGSAAATASRLTPVSLGSDTGGSIRQPASLCGVVGLKPTYGRISRYGLVAFASSLDQIGPITKNVSDAATLLTILGKHDCKDSTSANVEAKNYTKLLNPNIKGYKIGIAHEYFGEGLSSDIRDAIEKSVKTLESSGAEIIEISLPHTGYAIPVYYIIATAEASSNLARYDGVKYGFREPSVNLEEMYSKTRSTGFGPEVKRRIMLGTYVLSAGYYDAYYIKAQKVRTLIRQDFINAFEKVDIILTPTSPFTAFNIGEKVENPLHMYLCDVYTIPLNLFGGCGLSIPAGFDKHGLPVGLQLMGNHFEEEKILNCAYAFQQCTDFHKRIPQGFALIPEEKNGI